MNETFIALIGATFSIAFVHALAPDHWMPFVMIGRARKWTKKRLLLVTFVGALGHVGSSLILGTIGIALGVVTMIDGIEHFRGHTAILLLIGFGIGYAVWGLKHVRKPHNHSHDIDEKLSAKKTVTLWTVFAIFFLGPCEPLIPLMFLAVGESWLGVAVIAGIFSLVTVIVMLVLVHFASIGVRLINLQSFERYSHTFAGLVIASTALVILLMGHSH
jgi:nickel/cobalt transporter (NicO) family protein